MSEAPTLALPEAKPAAALERCLEEFLVRSEELHDSCSRLLARVESAERELDQMAATLAHEVRNPLHVIEGFASLLLRSLPPGADSERLRGYAGQLVRGARELSALVTGLLDLARPDRIRPAPCDVAAVARRAVELATAGLPDEAARRLDVSVEAGADCRALADEPTVLAAVRNLVANAIEAMPSGGAVRVRVAPEGRDLVVRVADDGPGVPPELRARIFAPFETTKARGTGLGLAVVARVAAAHGGRAELEPSARGAVFAFRIPRGREVRPVVRGACKRGPASGAR